MSWYHYHCFVENPFLHFLITEIKNTDDLQLDQKQLFLHMLIIQLLLNPLSPCYLRRACEGVCSSERSWALLLILTWKVSP